MRKCRLVFLVLLVFSMEIALADNKPRKPETPHLAFVSEYIRELAAFEKLRSAGEKELKQDPNATFSSMIHSGTLLQLELGSQIRMLQDMRLDKPFDELIPITTGFYERKIALWKRMVEISSNFVGGTPKPEVDYDKLAAEMPQVRAQLDYIDKTLLQSSAMVAMTLLDIKPDSKNHVSHLTITKDEKSKLIEDLETDFGAKLDREDQNYTVTTAQVLRDFLRNHRASDEPWE